MPQNESQPPRWYFTVWGVTALLLIFGPLAFPFLWKSSCFSRWQKIILTVVFTAATVWATLVTVEVFQRTLAAFRSVGLLP